MVYDADETLDALTAPTIKVRGSTYTLRYPTFLERLEIDRQWKATDWLDGESQADTVRFICGKVNMDPDPILGLPEKIMTEAVFYFLAISRGEDKGDLEILSRTQSDPLASAEPLPSAPPSPPSSDSTVPEYSTPDASPGPGTAT